VPRIIITNLQFFFEGQIYNSWYLIIIVPRYFYLYLLITVNSYHDSRSRNFSFKAKTCYSKYFKVGLGLYVSAKLYKSSLVANFQLNSKVPFKFSFTTSNLTGLYM